MEILNQVTLAGNLTDKPSIDDAGGRVFVRARLAQNWFYDTHGKTVEHRQFLPLTFLGESASVAKSFEKGDNIRHDHPVCSARLCSGLGRSLGNSFI